jgi:hypothetical protein
LNATGRGRRDGSLIPLVPPVLLVVSKQSRATRLPPAGNWVRFSCSISPLFVLSHNMSMANATGKLGSFWRFSITAGSLPSDLLATLLSPHAPRPTIGDRSCANPPRWLLPATDSQIGKDRTGSDLDERPVYAARLYWVCHQTRRFLRKNQSVSPTRLCPIVNHSLAAGGAQRQGHQTCRPYAHQPECLFSRCCLRKYSAW